jgi:hypothetical protein
MHIPFIRKRDPDYSGYFIPVDQGEIPVVYDELDGLPDPVRPSLFATAGEHRPAMHRIAFQFGPPIWQFDSYGGKLASPAPLAFTPQGSLTIERQRTVVERPPARGQLRGG